MIVLGIAILNAGVLAWFLTLEYRIDLDVYLLGAAQWLGGGDLYGLLPPTEIGQLPFTYPPFAAVVFAPFTLVPYQVASLLWTVLSIAALVLVMVLVLRSLGVRPVYARVGALLPVALLLEPVRATLCYGQINLLLMALVVLDCLVPNPRWRRGVLVGIAAAIKLTPIAFVLFFLLRKDHRAAVTALASFLGATVAAFLLNPSGSLRYWTSTVFNPDRIGGADVPANQSVKGLLARLGVENGLLWLVLAAVVVAVGAMAVRRTTRPVDALWLNALVVLLCSPISWSHHWVWVLPALLAARSKLAAAGAAAFMLAPQWWSGWLALSLGNAYVWCAIGVLVFWSADREFRRPRVHVHHRAVA